MRKLDRLEHALDELYHLTEMRVSAEAYRLPRDDSRFNHCDLELEIDLLTDAINDAVISFTNILHRKIEKQEALITEIANEKV